MLTFVVCAFLSFLTAVAIDRISKEFQKKPYISYETSKRNVQELLSELEQQLESDPGAAADALTETAGAGGMEAYVADTSGRVLLHSPGATRTQWNVYEALIATKDAISEPSPGQPYTLLSPIRYRGAEAYLIVSGPLVPEQAYTFPDHQLFNFIMVIVLFVFYFYLFTLRKMRNIRQMNRGLNRIADGELSVRLNVASRDELGMVAKNINGMAQRLEEQLERERRLEQSRMELITSVSHDLRTPLTSIIGYLTILKDQPDAAEAERKRYIENTYSKTDQLRRLIDDLFEYTKLSAGEVVLRKTEFDLINLLKQMLNEFEPIAQLQGVTIRSEWKAEPLPVLADSELIARAIDNLLINALKFSLKPGEIRIMAGTDYHGPCLCIENRGRPITKEQAEQLFDRFYKATPGEEPQPGAGLGLSITKNIVEMHGGRVWLIHEAGRFQFWIALPFPR